MQSWTTEDGTLWVFETNDSLPPMCAARVEVTFAEVGAADIDELAVAMNLATPELIHQRLQGRRRCFSLRVADQIVTYGWVTQGVEWVGELERQFQLHDDEAYIWDCGTVPAWRGQRGYSALLSQIIYRLQTEAVSRIWIGASRQNQPSIKGFVNAGFQRVIDLTYRRFYRLTMLRFQEAPDVAPPLIAAAYRILLDDHERRCGPLAMGYKR
jgi:ribosomal protein S18 acetylase RimI-like enzyme